VTSFSERGTVTSGSVGRGNFLTTWNQLSNSAIHRLHMQGLKRVES